MDTAEPTVVTELTTLSGETSGAITVADGGTLVIDGSHEGPVVLDGGAAIWVRGALRGSLEIGSLATATVEGDLIGRVSVRVAGTLVVETEGRLAGPVANYGSFTNRGSRTGPVEGRSPDDQEGAVEVEPTHPGVYNYALPARD